MKRCPSRYPISERENRTNTFDHPVYKTVAYAATQTIHSYTLDVCNVITRRGCIIVMIAIILYGAAAAAVVYRRRPPFSSSGGRFCPSEYRCSRREITPRKLIAAKQ